MTKKIILLKQVKCFWTRKMPLYNWVEFNTSILNNWLSFIVELSLNIKKRENKGMIWHSVVILCLWKKRSGLRRDKNGFAKRILNILKNLNHFVIFILFIIVTWLKLRGRRSSALTASPHMIVHVLIESLHHAGKNGDIRAITHGAMDQRVNGRTDKASYTTRLIKKAALSNGKLSYWISKKLIKILDHSKALEKILHLAPI